MNILLGISGGIAAYKSAELLRLLKASGHDVRVVMTPSATKFITPLTFQALSGYDVYTETFDGSASNAMDHIALGRWAELILIAPVTAETMAKLVQGRADNLLMTLCLAADCPIAMAPAMNQQMWLSESTQANLRLLLSRGVLCFGPDQGEQACGEIGPGRMLEPSALLEQVNALKWTESLSGCRLLITAGPTRELIDPVRYLSNRSTGCMGYAIANRAVCLNASVCLVSGPTHLVSPYGVDLVQVETAEEMNAAVMSRMADCDVFISAAAVADYRPDAVEATKIKKGTGTWTLSLVRNPDILASVAACDAPPITVGFAAETQDVLLQAEEKLRRKRIDMIVANQVGHDSGFGDCASTFSVFTKEGVNNTFSSVSKMQFAQSLLTLIAERLSLIDHF